MNGYLIAEEGPLAGMTVVFEEEEQENEWSLGRDPDTSDVILEDPMVSRQHALVTLSSEGFTLENLSTVNPVTQNGMVIVDPVLLKEGDIIQIGSTFFRFSEKAPSFIPPHAPLEPVERGSTKMSSELHFGPHPETRWLVKVISGPNTGAEFAMHRSSTYLIGKDPNMCDIAFQDLSVSRQHARLTIDSQDNCFVEDLNSRNGVIVNGELISTKQLLSSQDLIALGTTTFLVIDRKEARETIFSPPSLTARVAEPLSKHSLEKREWKDLIIPKRHLALAGVFFSLVFVSIFAMLSLFKSETVVVKHTDDSDKIQTILSKFPGVQFSFNPPSGKLFLIGHVLTTIDHQELLYLLKQTPFIQDIEDNVIVDELVWQNMNSLLTQNPGWNGVSVYALEPGKFVLRGYVNTLEEAEALNDYINLNFDYLERLTNEVVIEKNLQIEIASLLMEKGFANVNFEMSNGEVVFSGRITEHQQRPFTNLVSDLKKLAGIRIVKNFVVVTTEDSSRFDISNDYPVTGYAKRDDAEYYVLIKGRILEQGDTLDGMLITKIQPKTILLEKEGMKFKIDYSIQ